MKLLLPVIALCSVQIATSSVCYWNTGCPYKYFSNKTPYNFIRGDIRDSLVKLTGCEPVSIWGIIRHGQRKPGTEFGRHMREALTIKDYIVSSYEKGNCSLCAQDVENLRNWVYDKGMFDKPMQLTKEGYLEVEGIGQRLKQTFSKLLAKLEKNDFVFRHAHGARLADSAKAFIVGLNNKNLTIVPANTDFDVVAPYDTCRKYLSEVKNNLEIYAESVKFLTTSECLASKDRIQRRLGIDYPLTDVNFTALYDLCHYGSSGLENKFSPWCALFTTEDLKLAEYVTDLRNYYRGGYGTPMNELFGQITLADLLKSFQAAKSGNGKKITGYVSHATMMAMVFSALKLFKDDTPLTGALRNPDRKWRSSKFALYSANLMAVLNKNLQSTNKHDLYFVCVDGSPSTCKKDGKDDFNVVFYLNEEPLLPICREGVCTWQEFEEKLAPFLETSTDFCEVTVPTSERRFTN